MNNKFLIFSILTVILFSIVSVSASVSSVTTSSSASTATTGTSVTITASITDSTSETASASIITSPSGVTVSDPSGGQYQSVSLSTSPTSKTFTITASSPNTYSYYVTSGGTPSTSSTIVFVNPSTLTLSGSPSSTTVTSAGTFTESITISNPSASAVTTSYTLSCPSGFTCSGDPTSSSATTIAAGSSTTLSWTITVGGTSSSATISLQLGDTASAFSTSVTCSNCATTTTTTTTDTTTSSSAATTTTTAAGVKVATAKGNVIITIPSIAAGKSSLAPITATEDVAFTEVKIFVANPVKNIQITIAKLDSKPASITQEVSGKVYNYIQIDKNNTSVDTAVNQTNIKFKVAKSWLTTNNVDGATVGLYRYSDSQWNKLNTTKTGEDTDNLLYEAVSPGMSVFAISGELKAAAPTTTNETAVNQTLGIPTELLPNTKNYLVYIIIGVAAVGVIVYFVMKNKKGPTPNRRTWTDLKRKYS